MEKLIDINNLAELLNNLKSETSPTLVQLCSGNTNECFLMDEVVQSVQIECGRKLDYERLPEEASEVIKAELMTIKNPVLLLIQNGNIEAIFGGMISQHKLSRALKSLD